jgi:L-asparaginase
MSKVRIAHIAGPTATIQNTPPLVTSNKAREKQGLPPRLNPDGSQPMFDPLRPQRLAAPAHVYVEQFSAHPLESDAANLYAAPDGYLGEDGVFHRERRNASDKPVYEIELRPEDGLYPLPYMAFQADGTPWEQECAAPGAPKEQARQTFFPDGSRLFEEIDRLSVGGDGMANSISSVANVSFYRAAPSGGAAPEQRGKDFFAYQPRHLATQTPRPALATITNEIQRIADSGAQDGLIWTQGSPQVEETSYWFNLLVDTTLPICCNAAQRTHGQMSNDGPKNIADSTRFIASRAWADAEGRNKCGTVVIQEQQIFAARDVAKGDARPGGYIVTGGSGGILGHVGHFGVISLTYLPAYKHTYLSEVNINRLPAVTRAVRKADSGAIESIEIAVKDAQNGLLADAIPVVSIVKDGAYSTLDYGDDPALETDLHASIAHKLGLNRLTGFVVEGLTPYGHSASTAREKVMLQAVFSGLPVCRVGRGGQGFADPHPYQIAASNLTATKARLLLMACLMKFGSLPPAKDPKNPTADELTEIRAAIAAYQAVFLSH